MGKTRLRMMAIARKMKLIVCAMPTAKMEMRTDVGSPFVSEIARLMRKKRSTTSSSSVIPRATTPTSPTQPVCLAWQA